MAAEAMNDPPRPSRKKLDAPRGHASAVVAVLDRVVDQPRCCRPRPAMGAAQPSHHTVKSSMRSVLRCHQLQGDVGGLRAAAAADAEPAPEVLSYG